MATIEQTKTYIREIQKQYPGHLRGQLDFLRSIENMNLPEDIFRGNVGIIGQGEAFYEKSLITTPESDFTILLPDISQVVCCDPAAFTAPDEYDFDVPVINTILSAERPDRAVFYSCEGAGFALQRVVPDYFDIVTFLRIPSFASALMAGLLEDTSRTTKSGGYFIGSGDSQRELFTLDEDQMRELSGKNGYEVVSYTHLGDFDASGYPFSQNVGIILLKK